MNGLNYFAENWSVWMLHAGWQVTIVALLVFVILRIGHNRISSQLRYALLLIVLLKFATPPFLSLPIGMFSQPSVAQLTDVKPTPVFQVTSEAATIDRPDLESTAFSKPPSKTNAATPAIVETSPSTKLSNKSADSVPKQYSPLRLITCLLLLGYFTGVIAYLVRLVSQYLAIRKAVLASERQTAGALQDRLQQLTQRLRMKFRPELRISRDLDAPFAIGAFRPVIVLPVETINQLDSDQLDIVVAHELAHVRRRDMLIGWLETILTAMWWFHPAMWWLKSSLRQTREDCCDDMLIANQIAEPERYCETIIQAAARQTVPSLEPLALGFSNNEHPAGRRIRRLMNASIGRFDRLQLSAILFSLLVAAIAIPGVEQKKERAPVVETTLKGWGGWRNLPFDLEPEEEAAVRACVEISNRMRSTVNGVSNFVKVDARDDLNEILKKHPDCFYAKHLLGTWHRLNGDDQLATKLINESLQQAPIVLTRRYATGDGEPVAGLMLKGIAIECNRVQRHSLDSSLELKFVALVTDADGFVNLPVYDTAYQWPGIWYPNGYEIESKPLGLFESRAKVGVLPEALVWKTGSKPRNFSRSVADVYSFEGANGTDTLEIKSGGNVYRLGRIARGQSDNTFVSENGKGKPWDGKASPLPTLTNGKFMDHSLIDLASPVADRFEIAHVEVLDGQTSLPLETFQNGAGVVVANKNRIHLFSMWDKLPDSVSLVLTVYNYKESDFRHKFSANPKDDVEVEQGDNVLNIEYLGAGEHQVWSSKDGFVGEPESVDTMSEAIFRIDGQGRQKFSVWCVTKDGSRLDLKPSGWISDTASGSPVTIGAALDQIDHFELLPYRERKTIYFENIQLPTRQAKLDQELPSAQFEIGGEARSETCRTFAPLEIKFLSYPGDVYLSGYGFAGVLSFEQRNGAAGADGESTVIWITNAVCEFSSAFELFDGMDWSSEGWNRANTNFGFVCVQRAKLPLEQVQAARLTLRPTRD